MSNEDMPPEGAKSNSVVTVTRRFNDVAIGQRADGYLNATAMCKAADRQWGHYWENDTTKAFTAALSSNIGIPINELVVSRRGNGGGTWVHPQVGYHLAQWCSPAFAVQVTEWIHDIKTRGYATLPGVEIDADLIRRTDGVARSTIHKVTKLERRVADLMSMVETLTNGVTTLTLSADGRVAGLALIGVRKLMDEAGALSKGRKGLNQRVRYALLKLAATTGVKGVTDCPHTGVTLFPIDFAREFMANTGNAWVAAHNASLAPQGDLFAAHPTKKRKTKTPQPANDARPTAANNNSCRKRGVA